MSPKARNVPGGRKKSSRKSSAPARATKPRAGRRQTAESSDPPPRFDYDAEAELIADFVNIHDLEGLSAAEWHPLADRIWARRGFAPPAPRGGQGWHMVEEFHEAVHELIVPMQRGDTVRPDRQEPDRWPTHRVEAGKRVTEWYSLRQHDLPGADERLNMDRFIQARRRWPFIDCPVCGRVFVPKSRAKFCSGRCRKRAYREGRTQDERDEHAEYVRNWRKRKESRNG